METFIVIMRNAALVLIGITLFSAFFVAVSTWLVRNSHEENVGH